MGLITVNIWVTYAGIFGLNGPKSPLKEEQTK